MWTAPRAPAQAGPKLAAYFTELRATAIDPGFASTWFFLGPDTADLDGDGNQDLVALGANYPGSGVINTPQPGRVLLGDGDGHFTLASPDLFPVDSMLTVHPRKVIFADFNADQRPDMFISSHGWDAPPFPGEQNRMYLSRAEGGWRDATGDLPQLSDFSHTSAVGDISRRGIEDIFVGNGYSGIRPYFLLNTGSGQFVQTARNIPVSNNEVLDPQSGHRFAGATLDDLNDDGWPDLMVAADAANSSNRLRRSFILWNRSGAFVDGDRTELPSPAPFPNNHIDHDMQRMDVNQDGLQDLLVVGRQTIPLGGWFLQILINRGSRQFVDETAERMPQEESFGGIAGAPSSAPIAYWVRSLDFNQDGALDFYIIFQRDGGAFPRNHPLIWINDGTGHFSTWKLEDFVPSNKESLLGGTPFLVATRNGYSFISVFKSPSNGGALWVQGLLAAKGKLPGVGR